MSPARSPKIRNVERDIPNTRPRDTAIRKASNDNRVHANDNTRFITRSTAQPTIDETFSYSYIQQGLQPSVGAVAPYRSIQVQTTYNQREQQAPTGKREFQHLPGHKDSDFKRNPVTGEREFRHIPKTQKRALNPKKMLTGLLPGELAGVADRAFAIGTSMSILAWAGWAYVAQLLFAVLAVVFLGLSGGAKVISLGTIDPSIFFYLATLVATAIGYGTLLGMYLQYTAPGVACLSGKGRSLKFCMLLLAFVGYSLPFLNLFPWGLPWIIAVIYYPTA